jgi:hypothetical protein
MNNNKCKIEASVTDLIKSKKHEISENSMNDLIKPKKRFPYETSETSETSVTDLLKLQKNICIHVVVFVMMVQKLILVHGKNI